jgi:transposase-like protein
MTKQTEFPQTLQQAIIYFSDTDNCMNFLTQMRWPNGVECPLCESKELSYLSTRRIWKCKACKKQFSIKVGSLMEDSPITLDKWLAAIWLIANAKNGISSYEIHRGLGITQKSAWFLLHRIRSAMENGTFKKLSGTVEVDETAIGGLSKNMHKWKRERRINHPGQHSGKVLVMGLLERHGEAIVRVIPDVEGKTLKGHIRNHVEAGSEVFTDGFGGYKGMTDYVHDFVQHSEEYVRGRVHTNGIENFWCLLKRMIKGTYVSVEPFHLFRYLDEQSFRFNTRKGTDADRFVKAAAALTGKRLTYDELIGKGTETCH